MRDAGRLIGVWLLSATLTPLFRASARLKDYYDRDYEDYYPTLFRRDHRQFFVSVDHRHIYCDCSVYRQRSNVSAQARVGTAVPTSEFSPPFSRNNTDLISIVQLDQTGIDELDSVDPLVSGHSSVTSSTLTARQQQQQQQLLYVVLPCVTAMIVVVVVITAITISLLRRRLRYVDKSSEQESVNLTSLGAGQPPPVGSLQLCATQQHQLLLDTMTLRHPSDVINGDNQSLAAEKRAPADVTAADSMCSYADWTAIAPTRKEVTVRCYLDTSSVRAVLVPKTP